MTFTNKSNKQLIHELQDDINNINSSSASEISDINGLQAELNSKQQWVRARAPTKRTSTTKKLSLASLRK